MSKQEQNRPRTSPVVHHQHFRIPVVDGWSFDDSTQAFRQNTPSSHTASEQSISDHRSYDAPSIWQRRNPSFGNAPSQSVNFASKKNETKVMGERLVETSMLTQRAEQEPSTATHESSQPSLGSNTHELRESQNGMNTSSLRTEPVVRDADDTIQMSSDGINNLQRHIKWAADKVQGGGPVLQNSKWPSEHDDALVRLLQAGASLKQIVDVLKPRTQSSICQHAKKLYQSGKIEGPLRDDIRLAMTRKDMAEMRSLPGPNEESVTPLRSPDARKKGCRDGQPYTEEDDRILMEADRNGGPTEETTRLLGRSTPGALRKRAQLVKEKNGNRVSNTKRQHPLSVSDSEENLPVGRHQQPERAARGVYRTSEEQRQATLLSGKDGSSSVEALRPLTFYGQLEEQLVREEQSDLKKEEAQDRVIQLLKDKKARKTRQAEKDAEIEQLSQQI